jgi:hypothetical protein
VNLSHAIGGTAIADSRKHGRPYVRSHVRLLPTGEQMGMQPGGSWIPFNGAPVQAS